MKSVSANPTNVVLVKNLPNISYKLTQSISLYKADSKLYILVTITFILLTIKTDYLNLITNWNSIYVWAKRCKCEPIKYINYLCALLTISCRPHNAL